MVHQLRKARFYAAHAHAAARARLSILKIGKTISIVTVTAIFMVAATVGFAQFPNDGINTRKNLISLTISFHEFFCSLPQTPLLFRVGNIVAIPSFGLSYFRQLNDKSGFTTEIKYYSANRGYGFDLESPCNHDGRVVWRRFLELDAEYSPTVFASDHFFLNGILGLSFRQGYEVINSCIPRSFEAEYFRLRDLGAVVGLGAKRTLGKRLTASANLRFTEYLYRSMNGPEPWYTNWAKHGTTRHMLTLQLGLGYRF